MKKVKIAASRPYEFVIGDNLLATSGKLIKEYVHSGRLMIIVDENVHRLYFDLLSSVLESEGIDFDKYILPSGEKSKELLEYSNIIDKMVQRHFDRDCAVISFGGGVCGDLAGFVASTYMRGVKLIHVPTTLLSQCDSSIGGKNALDIAYAKNIIGTVYQPQAVLCDVSFLDTLPRDVFFDGMGEILKYAMLSGEDILRSNSDFEMISRAIEIKAAYVTADEYDSSSRRFLNLGHTVGHALEVLSNYTLGHGHAVASGMRIITNAAVRKGICSRECLDKLDYYIDRYKLREDSLYCYNDEIFNVIASDKKLRCGKLALVVPKGFGECKIINMSFADACEFIKGGFC